MPLDDGTLPLGNNNNLSDQINDDNSLIEPDFVTKNKDFRTKETGSVFINGQSSYSGADIKVVVHIYDNGKAAKDRKEQLQQKSKELNAELNSKQRNMSQLSDDLNADDAVFTPDDVNRLNSLNQQTVVLSNTLLALDDEIERLGDLEPRISTKVLAELQTISVSTHRDKYPIRALGSVYPKSFVRGSRSIAGSMIFTVFDKNVLEEFLQAHPSDFDAHNTTTSAVLDQIPPFDITIAFANELGQVSRMAIYGVEFINEGQTMSIEDIFLENVVQYVARDIDPMRVVSRRKIDEGMRLTEQIKPLSASALLTEDDYRDFKNKLSPFERFTNRGDPFV